MTHAQVKTATSARCWSCGAPPGGARFCEACGRIQPPVPGADYFALLGLPRKLQVDAADLEKRFHSLNWKLHPDNFIHASERERAFSMEHASQINDAYRTLREPVRRVEYLLQQAGLRKEGTAKQQAPPELLEEVFELNEALGELREAKAESDGSQLAALRAKLEAAGHTFERQLETVDTELNREFARWDASLDTGDESARGEAMQRMNEILNRRSYIRNLVASVNKELAD